MNNDIWGEEEPWLAEGFIQTLLDKTNFTDILDKYNIDYYRTGDSYKLRCPFPEHDERTPSFHVTGPLFKCFGCNAGGSIIEFVMLYRGMPRNEAVREIAAISGVTGSDIDEDFVPVFRNPEHTVLPYIFKSGVLIRNFLKSVETKDHYRWGKRADKWFKRLDHYMVCLEDEDWEIAKQYHEKIRDFIIKNGGNVK